MMEMLEASLGSAKGAARDVAAKAKVKKEALECILDMRGVRMGWSEGVQLETFVLKQWEEKERSRPYTPTDLTLSFDRRLVQGCRSWYSLVV